MFETEVDDWRYATDGGTAFIINFRNQVFGITAKHALGTFNWRQLALTNEKFGDQVAGLSAIHYPSEPTEAAEGSDVLDIVAIKFSDDVDAAFFRDSAYILESRTMCGSESGDVLLVNGALKDQSSIADETISARFALLEFSDHGPSCADPVLREAIAKFDTQSFSRLTGLSGSPVFNRTKRCLCGMAVRGVLHKDVAIMRYIEITDVVEILTAIVEGTLRTQYAKSIIHPTTPA